MNRKSLHGASPEGSEHMEFRCAPLDSMDWCVLAPQTGSSPNPNLLSFYGDVTVGVVDETVDTEDQVCL